MVLVQAFFTRWLTFGISEDNIKKFAFLRRGGCLIDLGPGVRPMTRWGWIDKFLEPRRGHFRYLNMFRYTRIHTLQYVDALSLSTIAYIYIICICYIIYVCIFFFFFLKFQRGVLYLPTNYKWLIHAQVLQ